MSRMGREHALTTLAAACTIIGCGATAWWAFGPVDHAEDLARVETSTPPKTSAAAMRIDASVFDVVLWPEPEPIDVAEPATASASMPPSPPPPPLSSIKLTLVAIVEVEGGWHVALYDPSSQRIVFAGPGDLIGDVRVREVTASTVLLELAGRTRQLALHGGAP